MSTPKSENPRGLAPGMQFFLRPILASRPFMFVSLVCLGETVLVLLFTFHNWQRLSESAIAILGAAVFFIVEAWWRTHGYHRRIHELLQDGSFGEVTAGSPLDSVLDVCGGLTTSILGSSALFLLLLLLYLYVV